MLVGGPLARLQLVLANPRERLAEARVYLICDGSLADERIEAALRGGVDVVQIRLPDSRDDAAILAAALRLRPLCERHSVPLLLDDRPDLVIAAQADGVHLESAALDPITVREQLGPEALIGVSAGSPELVDATAGLPVDYISVGPVFSSTTKPGSPAIGHGLVTYASRTTLLPVFAVGGIEPHNAGSVAAAGGSRIAVAATIATSPDPERSAAVLKSEITAPADFIERYRARTEAQNAAARAKLTPLAPGERPSPLRVSVALATFAALLNLIAYVAGDTINGSRPNAGAIILFSAVMFVLAAGMWQLSGVAVLLFMAILAVIVVLFSLFLVEASNPLGIIVPLFFIVGGGLLFWKLVRVLGRIQAPPRPSRVS